MDPSSVSSSRNNYETTILALYWSGKNIQHDANVHNLFKSKIQLGLHDCRACVKHKTISRGRFSSDAGVFILSYMLIQVCRNQKEADVGVMSISSYSYASNLQTLPIMKGPTQSPCYAKVYMAGSYTCKFPHRGI